MTTTLRVGNNEQILKEYADNTFDSIVTDPPYHINFLGKAWDNTNGTLATYQECLRVLKPGGHIVAFSAARTYHQLAVVIEQAGFEIRDQLMWLYSSGFPKSQDVGKSIQRSEGKRANCGSGDKWSNADGGKGTNTTTCRTCKKTNVQIGVGFNCDAEVCDMRERLAPADNEWAGWGTALKPAHEPIVLARKPVKQSIAKNVQEWSTGALNIDATRVPADTPPNRQVGYSYGEIIGGADPLGRKKVSKLDNVYEPNAAGRYPSNVLGTVEGYQHYFYQPTAIYRLKDDTPAAVISKIKEYFNAK